MANVADRSEIADRGSSPSGRGCRMAIRLLSSAMAGRERRSAHCAASHRPQARHVAIAGRRTPAIEATRLDSGVLDGVA